MKFSFIVPAHNEERYLSGCLESILKEAGRGAPSVEVIVVNNASTDKTGALVSSYPGVRVVDEPEKGLTKARQKGLKEASGDLLAYIDADARIPEGWLRVAQEEFLKDPALVALSGPPKYYDLSGPRRFFAELGWDIAPLAYRLVGYMIYGANFVAKKSALESIGGFDARIEFHGEDTDLARRLSRVGTVKFTKKLFIYNSGRRLIEEGLLKTYAIYAGNFLWQILFKKPMSKTYNDVR